MVKGYNWRQDQEWKKLRWASWHIGFLMRVDGKDFPGFEQFVND